MSQETLLSFDSVSFSYDDTQVLTSLSLQVDCGEIAGFLGVNGAGKTTTFLLATGLLTPASGTIAILACEPVKQKDWTYGVGALMSGAGLYPRLTVRRNLAFFAELYSLKVDLDKHLARHGLSDYANKPAGVLSQGYRRRLALARVTLHSPRLLLLDEPADGLDPRATEHLHQFLRDFRDEGGGVLLTSHRLEEVERLCDRVLLLSEGKIAHESTPQALAEEKGGQGLRNLVLKLQAEQR